MPFSTRLIIRFGETDPAGLVYYPNLFHYLHIALEEFFAARCGITYPRLISDERLGFPTVNVQTDFLVPLVYGDEALIEVYVSRAGVSSATFEYSIKRVSDGVLCVRATHVQVAMNLDTRRAVPIPERFRQAFLDSCSS